MFRRKSGNKVHSVLLVCSADSIKEYFRYLEKQLDLLQAGLANEISIHSGKMTLPFVMNDTSVIASIELLVGVESGKLV